MPLVQIDMPLVQIDMPLVQIKGVGGFLTLQQKQEMIRKVTDAVRGRRRSSRRYVGHNRGRAARSLGVGGTPVTDDDLRRMAGSKSAA